LTELNIKKCGVALLVVICMLHSGPLEASEPVGSIHSSQSIWISPGFYSVHFDRNAGLRDANPGFGLQGRINPEWSLTGGRFANSNDRYSNYIGGIYTPWSWGRVRIGGVIAAFDGYPNMRNGGWFASVIPTIGLYGDRLALNVGIIPELKDRVQGAISFQIMLRVY
jgi:hypothetical protein